MLLYIIFIFGVIITTATVTGIIYDFDDSPVIPHNHKSDATNRVDYDGMGDYSRYPKIERA
ncbi:MAG: hypothetical protein EA391_02740 [Balneolaceae bacterium]|nr:MAG: hypothetical protein EA391_02740 [Balneolaceae bacterium]